MAGENSFQVTCACGEKHRAPMSAVGKKGRCPGCGSAITLTPPAQPRSPVVAQNASPVVAQAAAPVRGTVSVPAPAGTSVSLDDLDDIGESYDVAEDVQAAAAPRISLCPGCRSQLDSGAVLCVKCGYDTRTGKALAAPAVKTLPYASPNGGKPQIDMMAAQGKFLTGLAMCAVFAGAASLIWIGVAWATGYAFAYIAMVIGGAAGAGMKIGQDGFSGKGGFVASGMTMAAIILAKIVVLELVMARHHSDLSIFQVRFAGLAHYIFTFKTSLFMLIGMLFAFRTANGSFTD